MASVIEIVLVQQIAESLNEAYSLGYAPEKGLSNDDRELRSIEVRLPGLDHSIQQSRTQYRFESE